MFTRYAIRTLLCIAAVPAISDESAPTHDRVFLSKTEIESTLIGKPIVSNNLATGMVSSWQFYADGRVDFANRSGPGRVQDGCVRSRPVSAAEGAEIVGTT